MAKIVMDEYTERSVLPDSSIVFLKVDSQETKEVDGKNGKWQKLEFTFKLLGIQVLGDGGDISEYDDLIGGKIFGSVPFTFTDSPENKLKQWVEALLGMELVKGFELDTDILDRREARGITRQFDKRAIDVHTGKPFRGHGIDSLLPKGGTILGTPAPVVHSEDFFTPTTRFPTPATQANLGANLGAVPVSVGAGLNLGDDDLDPPF